MGSYTFKWEKPAKEVIITGLFDDWAKSIKMDKKGEHFQKTVTIPEEHIQEGKKVYYKFVVDGNWIARDDARGEYYGNNFDNFLLPEDIEKDTIASTISSTISSVAPGATTTSMAGEVPQEPRLQEEKEVPGAFPETPGATPAGENQTFSVNPIPASEGAGNPIKLAAGEPVPDPSNFNKNTISSTVEDNSTSKKEIEPEAFSVAPIPATAGVGNPIYLAPGEKVPDPSTLTSNTISSTVEGSDPEPESEKTFSVAPIPATAGIGNPVSLAPGEKVPDPSTLTSNTIQSTVSDDRSADALPQENGKTTNGAASFGVPPISSSTIPESSLPIGNGNASKEVDTGPFITSAGAGTTTATLAGHVPKEPRADHDTTKPTIQSVGPTATTAGLAAAVPKEPRADRVDPTISSAGAGTTTAALAGQVPKASTEVPEIVSESQAAARADPEASASAQAVIEKSAVETELLKEVKPVPATAESVFAPSSDAVIPDKVKQSIAAADAPAEAATNPVAITEKAAVEEELKKTVPEENSRGEPAPTGTAVISAIAPGDGAADEKGLNASKESPAKTPAIAAAAAAVSVPSGPADSRDVSPMSKTATKNHPNPGQQSIPAVVTGTSTTTAPTKTEAGPATPKKDTVSTPQTPETTASKKKKNRLSGFFHKIEEKIKGHKDK